MEKWENGGERDGSGGLCCTRGVGCREHGDAGLGLLDWHVVDECQVSGGGNEDTVCQWMMDSRRVADLDRDSKGTGVERMGSPPVPNRRCEFPSKSQSRTHCA